MTGNSSIDISLANVWNSYRSFRKGKKPTIAVINFEAELMENILGLARSLQDGSYRHGPYAHMIVSDRKRRDIAVASVNDRIVHRMLYDYLVTIWDRTFIYDAWSCRQDKGLYKAIDRAQLFMRRHKDCWVWRADITKLFDSVDKELLKEILRMRTKDELTLWLLDEVINGYSSFDEGKGIPIGNLTSQIFANIYLNEFDRFMLHRIKPLDYLRYGDDWLCFGTGNDRLQRMRFDTESFLNKKLGLYINPQVNQIKPVRKGVSYLGADLWPGGKRIDNTAKNKIYTQLNFRNVPSYRSFIRTYESDKQLERFRWMVMDRIDYL